MGRRKIEIEPLSDERNRTVTFVKRKAGLFKKAHELAVLCQVDLAVIIIGNNNKIYEFSLVDTQDLIGTYQKQTKSKKPHESKSHDNYSEYRKKKKVTDLLSLKDGNGPTEDLDLDSSDSEYDSEPAKKKAKNNNVNIPNSIKENQRPVLRVQIPKDEPNQSQDSGKTLTALETGPSGASKDPPNLSNNLNLSKYSNYTSYRSPDSRKPPVLLPIHAKSQSSSPADVTAPQLPFVANTYFSQQSPNGNYPNILPTPILNQVLNPSFENSNNHNNHNNHNNNNNNNNNNNATTTTTTNTTNANSNSSSITSTNSTHLIDKNRLNNPKFRPPLITNFNSENHPPAATNTEQTPFSSLRNVYEMFPSPSTFYNSQDWPQGNTGMTPIHVQAGNYFMGMLPSGGPSGPSGGPSGSPSGPPGGTGPTNQPNNGNLPFQGNYSNQNRQSGSFPSPLQYMGQGFNQKKS